MGLTIIDYVIIGVISVPVISICFYIFTRWFCFPLLYWLGTFEELPNNCSSCLHCIGHHIDYKRGLQFYCKFHPIKLPDNYTEYQKERAVKYELCEDMNPDNRCEKFARIKRKEQK